MKVLHYKSNFLNASETFIKRLIVNHRSVHPVAMCFKKQSLTNICATDAVPKGLSSVVDTVCFHLNWCLPFYTKTIMQHQPDIIHAHFGYDGYRMIKPSQKTNIPLVVSFYGSDVTRLPNEFDWKRRYRNLAEMGNAFIAVSELMKNKLIELGFPEEKITVVRFGIDLNTFHFNSTYSSENRLMMVGRMVEKKGFEYALEAVKILKDQGHSYAIDLYGDGILKPKLQEKAKKWGISHLVHFYGHKYIKTIRNEYQKHSLLLVPSVTASDGDQEGIPNTLLEGMASGIPVVATRHSAIPEVLTHRENGLLVDEKDASQLAEMISCIIENKVDISSMREKARTHIEKHYTIDRMVTKVENVYQHLIA